MSGKITADWSIGKLIEKYPKSVEVLINYNFHCIGCALAQYETIEQGARAHGLNKKQISKLLEELNKLTSKRDKQSKS